MMKDAAVEIQLLIASHAHTPFDLARLGSTSRSWRIACNDDRSWRRFALEFSIPGSVSGFGEGASERGSGADGSEKTTCWTTFAAHARRHPGRLLLAHAFVAPRVARLALRLGLDIDIKNAHSEAPIRLFLTREEEEAGTVELVNLSEDESDRITPSPTWRPSLRDCTQVLVILPTTYPTAPQPPDITSNRQRHGSPSSSTYSHAHHPAKCNPTVSVSLERIAATTISTRCTFCPFLQ
ncbi:hypothetical protein BC830DRAFT_163511 [Chytriomyces sp. MP71]|nr:hypothetical protein BC830DRAFT_163511 [Chytriomyces sp. MP71]